MRMASGSSACGWPQGRLHARAGNVVKWVAIGVDQSAGPVLTPWLAARPRSAVVQFFRRTTDDVAHYAQVPQK